MKKASRNPTAVKFPPRMPSDREINDYITEAEYQHRVMGDYPLVILPLCDDGKHYSREIQNNPGKWKAERYTIKTDWCATYREAMAKIMFAYPNPGKLNPGKRRRRSRRKKGSAYPAQATPALEALDVLADIAVTSEECEAVRTLDHMIKEVYANKK